jgi:CRISPR-associated protein Csh2
MSVSKIVANRSEIIFLYDISYGNPNGDAIDNKPRIDEKNNYNIVTDVRLKRTIRDYLLKFKQLQVLIRKETEDGKVKTREKLIEEHMKNKKLDIDEIKEKYIDIRLFGGTFAIEDNNFALTGPVQFKFGRSLHRVSIEYIKGTTVLPSGEGKAQGTFWETYVLPYSLVCFYGVVNENVAKETSLTEQDIDYLLEAIYYGTNNLITRSKPSQQSRLLLQIIYKENNFHIGDLDKKIKLKLAEGIESEESIRSYEDYVLDFTQFLETIKNKKEKIKEIKYIINPNLRYVPDLIQELKNQNIPLSEIQIK